MATIRSAPVPTQASASAAGRSGKSSVLSARASSVVGSSLRMQAPVARSVGSTRICASAREEASRIITAQGSPVMVPRTQEMGGDPFGLLMKKRIVFLGSQVDDFTADAVISQLLLLDAQNPEEDIQLFINSPGGSVTAGMGIYDAMQMCRADVSTVCFGLAASMGAFLLNAGAKGKRYSMPNARIMIHQPLGGASGNAVDIEIQAREIMYHKANLNRLISFHCGVPVEQVDEDTDRDRYMSPLEAKEYGLIDHIIGGDEAVMKVEGDVESFGKTKKEYIAWWKDAESDGGDSGGGFSGKPIEPYMPTPSTPSGSE